MDFKDKVDEFDYQRVPRQRALYSFSTLYNVTEPADRLIINAFNYLKIV